MGKKRSRRRREPISHSAASLIGRLSRALQMESYPKFHNEVGVSIVRIGCREFKCIGEKPPQDHLISTSLWAIPARSSAPIARRCSVTIRAWANTKLIQQIVLTATWTDACGTSTPLYRETPRPACTAKRLTIPLRPRRLYTQRLGPGVLARNSWASARSVCNVASSRHRSDDHSGDMA